MFCCVETKIANKHRPFVQRLGFPKIKSDAMNYTRPKFDFFSFCLDYI